uniref:Cationic amino acid transporter 2, vacuolar (Trinotate prediction) n=1 Tax=Henneguya salminicola TaxID=69463 RepID=A0A6G3ML25_HENSL
MILYISCTSIMTLILPYNFFDAETTLITAFSYHKDWLGIYIITLGAFTGFIACILTSFFPVPRILFAMSNDGLIPSYFGNLSDKSKIPKISFLATALLISMYDVAFM